MAGGQDEPADRDDGRVLAPEELDLSDDEHVAELEEGRYVVSPNDPIDDSSAAGVASRSDSADTGTAPDAKPAEERPSRDPEALSPAERRPAESQSTQSPEITEGQVHDWIESELDGVNSRYGFDVTAKFDGSVRQRQMMSNDVVTTFESLILWCAQNIDRETPVEEILGILLMESNVPIRYPPESLKRAVQNNGLGPEDTIADLMDAVEDDGLKF